jgi:hypothetical protein
MLFDLTQDPGEFSSLAEQDTEHLAKGRQLLDDAVAAAAQLREQIGVGPSEHGAMNEKDMLALKAMGYL